MGYGRGMHADYKTDTRDVIWYPINFGGFLQTSKLTVSLLTLVL